MQTGREALKHLNWKRALWMPALLFLFNPYMHGLDILPDVIGYMLLVKALCRVALLDESFGETVRLLRRLALLSVGRLVALGWILSVPSAEEQPTLILLLCFAAGVLELMTVIPACHQLFHGLSYVASRLGGTVVLESARDAKVRRLHERLARMSATDGRRALLERRIKRVRASGDMADRMCLVCQTFAVAKTVLCVLPELTALSDASYRAGATLFPWYAYVGGFRAVAVTVGLVIGAVWLWRMLRYCVHLERDCALWCALAERCDEDDASHPERLPRRRLRVALTLMLVAFAFCTNFSVDGLNVLPGFVTSLLLLATLWPLGPYLSRPVKAVSAICFGLHAVASAVAYVMSLDFYANYDLYAYFRSTAVKNAYDRVCVASVAEAAVTAVAYVALCLIAACLIRRYTGAHGAATFACTKEEMARRRRHALYRHLLPVLLLGLLSAAMHAATAYWIVEYEFIWLPDVALSLLLLLFAWLRLHDLVEELDPKQMLSDAGLAA